MEASRKMEAKLQEVLKEFGFERNESLEEHPSEFFSYKDVFTSTRVTASDAGAIRERLGSISPHYGKSRYGDDELALDLSDRPDPNPDRDTRLIRSIAVIPDGAAKFEKSGQRFVALTVHYELVYPEFTLAIMPYETSDEEWETRDARWRVTFTNQRTVDAVLAARRELQPKKYVETQVGFWHTFQRGLVTVSVGPASEIRIDGKGNERFVVRFGDAGEREYATPAVITLPIQELTSAESEASASSGRR